jgi:hypothetical protein
VTPACVVVAVKFYLKKGGLDPNIVLHSLEPREVQTGRCSGPGTEHGSSGLDVDVPAHRSEGTVYRGLIRQQFNRAHNQQGQGQIFNNE